MNCQTTVEIVGAAVVEDGHYLEEGEITEFVSERKETYEDVHVNPDLSAEQKKEIMSVLVEFQDVFTDLPKVTGLGEHSTWKS